MGENRIGMVETTFMNPHTIRLIAPDGTVLDEERTHEVFVCPGCHCVGAEPHASDCIDEEIRREREDAYDRGERYDDSACADCGYDPCECTETDRT